MTLDRQLPKDPAPQEQKTEATTPSVWRVTGCHGRYFYAKEVFRTELEGQCYRMLAPLDSISGLHDGCAPVFRLKEDGIWIVERDEETVKKIYGRYYQSGEDIRHDGRA